MVTRDNAPIVLGLDPGFASFGWAKIRLAERGPQVVSAGVIRTRKDSKRRHTFASEDNLVRARAIYQQLSALVEIEFDPVGAMCVESMSFPRNSSAAAKVAMAWGVVAAVTEAERLPVVQASPQFVKQALTGKRSASKEEVAQAVDGRLNGSLANIALAGLPRGEHEHAYDAAAVALACQDSDQLRMLLRRVG